MIYYIELRNITHKISNKKRVVELNSHFDTCSDKLYTRHKDIVTCRKQSSMYILEKNSEYRKRESFQNNKWLAIILHSKKLHKIQNTWNGSFSIFLS